MKFPFREALKAGVESVTAWADYLDAINVFPVADGDTGRNLVLSLTPLRDGEKSKPDLVRDLLLQARGNSGNLAAQFFAGLLDADAWDAMPAAAARGAELAFRSIPEPKTGTILSLFGALAEQLSRDGKSAPADGFELVLGELEKTVGATTEQLPQLRDAGVVDAGALGMFFFFEGFLRALAGREDGAAVTSQHLRLFQQNGKGAARVERGFCLDAAVRTTGPAASAPELADLGESVVATRHDDILKIHFHAGDSEAAKARLAQLGAIVQLSVDDLHEQTTRFAAQKRQPVLHVMTDAAGSVTRDDAERYGFTLAASYIQIGDKSLPETYLDPQALYRAMSSGVKVGTSQASVFERQQYFRKVLSVHPRALYLCVGSVFTGNFAVAMQWKRQHDPENRLLVHDTAAASGRLGLVALATVRFSLTADDPEAVVDFARRAEERCEEYIFVDRLKFLAAGGRMPKPVSFVGDMFRFKPVISPMADGAKPVAWVKSRDEQLAFALERLGRAGDDRATTIMLEFTDNRDWVEANARPALATRCPNAEIIMQPFSLTTGAHVGPQTWGLSFLPESR